MPMLYIFELSTLCLGSNVGVVMSFMDANNTQSQSQPSGKIIIVTQDRYQHEPNHLVAFQTPVSCSYHCTCELKADSLCFTWRYRTRCRISNSKSPLSNLVTAEQYFVVSIRTLESKLHTETRNWENNEPRRSMESGR